MEYVQKFFVLSKEKTNGQLYWKIYYGKFVSWHEAVGGKIYLYENYLEIKAHTLNIKKGITQIEYADLESITK